MTAFAQGFGLERAATAVLETLMDELNEELEQVEEAYVADDQRLAARRGIPYVPVELEPVQDKNFYLGHKPSLIENSTPLDDYPNIQVMAYRAGRAGTDLGDHWSEFTDALYVETLVKASPAEGEEVCDKRAWRTAEAIHNVLMRDRSLRGTVAGIATSPSCLISEVFKRPKNPEEGHGDDWFWQASRIEVGVNKISPFEG